MYSIFGLFLSVQAAFATTYVDIYSVDKTTSPQIRITRTEEKVHSWMQVHEDGDVLTLFGFPSRGDVGDSSFKLDRASGTYERQWGPFCWPTLAGGTGVSELVCNKVKKVCSVTISDVTSAKLSYHQDAEGTISITAAEVAKSPEFQKFFEGYPFVIYRRVGVSGIRCRPTTLPSDPRRYYSCRFSHLEDSHPAYTTGANKYCPGDWSD